MRKKLLNFIICQMMILIVIGLSMECVVCQEQKQQNVTEYDRSFKRLLSRRKRFLIFRAGSNVLVIIK